MGPLRLYYDWNCPFCRQLAKWGQRYFSSPGLEWIGADYTDPAQLPLAVESVIYQEGERYWVKSEAIRRLLLRGKYRWAGWLMGIVPLRWRDALYDWVAARRYCNGACLPRNR